MSARCFRVGLLLAFQVLCVWRAAAIQVHGARVLCQVGFSRAFVMEGRCAAEADLSDMNLEQKLAFSDFCAVQFPCQVARAYFLFRGSCSSGFLLRARVEGGRIFTILVPGRCVVRARVVQPNAFAHGC